MSKEKKYICIFVDPTIYDEKELVKSLATAPYNPDLKIFEIVSEVEVIKTIELKTK